MDTFLGSLVQSYCGEGGTLQTNNTGMCGEFLQCMDYTGFAPAQGVCAFPVYTAQALGCSTGKLSKVGPGFCVLSCSGSGSRVLHKGTDSVGHVFCALPRLEQLRRPDAWQAHCPRWAVFCSPPWSQTLGFLGVLQEHRLRCAVCLLWGADLWLRPSWQMSTVQDPRKS